jgi:predicted RNase H-like HicB family nuclease
MELKITIEIAEKGGAYLARAPELDLISQGPTLEEAKRNLLEVITIQFHEMKEMGTLDEYLAECGFIKKDNQVISTQEVVGFEKAKVVVG